MAASGLGAVMGALQALGDAVTHDDVDAYRAALTRAREAGCTKEQIDDAWQWRASQRLRSSWMPPVSFDVDGKAR